MEASEADGAVERAHYVKDAGPWLWRPIGSRGWCVQRSEKCGGCDCRRRCPGADRSLRDAAWVASGNLGPDGGPVISHITPMD
jgi:hypothetical protein